eukprot:CAMPEP_0118924360 /NCGR_PEP_ID=MMETSP1169-20130426/2531_1 /TAXON_ID=36882 /ORGANISM="Pyramimonas obovata, Strain CCMP722" /LENGTH=405 /DNA_ID=CAMNT_0006865463 /DNA_START=254 /DNA_END=1468 /DNA_ORIENTATION=-
MEVGREDREEMGSPLHKSCHSFMQHSLSASQIHRYSRQILMPQVGTPGQEKICKSSVLVVGAGGLGSPVCLYLVAAGIGHLGIVDQDVVELSNLHRQIAHTEKSVGTPKTTSAAETCRNLNSEARITCHDSGFTPENAVEIARGYDVVVDCTDNPSTRYLINDACVAARVPLVSGSSVGMEGQLTVYNHGAKSPCLRCVFPNPTPVEHCSRCSDSGVLGMVPGIIGSMQALEALKIVANLGSSCAGKLLMFDAMCTSWHTIKLKERDPKCAACGEMPVINANTIASYDYNNFSGPFSLDRGPQDLDLLPASSRVPAAHLAEAMRVNPEGILLVDVRPALQYKIAALPGSVNIPYDADWCDKVDEVIQLARNPCLNGYDGGRCASMDGRMDKRASLDEKPGAQDHD